LCALSQGDFSEEIPKQNFFGNAVAGQFQECSEITYLELRKGAPISQSACGLFAKDRADWEIGAPGAGVEAALFLSS